jgi:hypothetical protein
VKPPDPIRCRRAGDARRLHPVLKTVGKQGDFKDGVLKVNIPRSDLKVSVDGIATPTPFGFGGWFALPKAVAARTS